MAALILIPLAYAALIAALVYAGARSLRGI
jgi:hypothetical protein